ncbi:MAG TPA: TolC family protein [Bryobacteraceae bacterium]|nr:TolC family protein [Bryobacteraceae bacterium]
MNTKFLLWFCATAFSGIAAAQVATPLRLPVAAQAAAAAQAGAPASTSAPLMLTLKDALERAAANAPQVLAALGDASAAHEDLLQTRAGRKPSLTARSEYLGTQGNGVFPSGRYVTNDGVHVYREWALVHQDFMAAGLKTGVQRAAEMEALAKAKAEIARRGLAPTVAKAYYALLTGQRKYSTAQLALDQAMQYLDISQKLERGGEVAHSDVVKAQIQYATQEQVLRESKLAIDTARLDLSVLLFRDFNQNFSVVDDLDTPAALPPMEDITAMAERENPDLRAANSAVRAAKLDIAIARQGYLPTLTADLAYGIEANAFAFNSTVAADPLKGKQPNLGYFLTVSLNVPVWDWGTRASKVRQAGLKHEEATVDLSVTQRMLLRNLQGFYLEAQTAREQAEALRRSVDLAAESLRLNVLRYQAAEASILDLVDAQTTLIQARNAYDDGLVRYRMALANLETLTGPF